MANRRILAGAVAAATLLLQSCVEYYPTADVAPATGPVAQATPPPEGPPPPPGLPPQAPLGALVQLLRPIALYPDPLLALVLPACTAPGDIQAANQYLIQYGDPTLLGSQPWDPNVRALAHYPTVLGWLAQNMNWTRAVGSEFAASPADVMRAVQVLRQEAFGTGVLASTPQQQVYSENGVIYILPNKPGTLFVPVYDADLAFSDQAESYGTTCLAFSDAYPAGPWLSMCFDWSSGGLWAGGWASWHEGGIWHEPRFSASRPPPGFKAWRPAPQAVREPVVRAAQPSPQTPRPMPGAPALQSGRGRPNPVRPQSQPQGREQGGPPAPARAQASPAQPQGRVQQPVQQAPARPAPQARPAPSGGGAKAESSPKSQPAAKTDPAPGNGSSQNDNKNH